MTHSDQTSPAAKSGKSPSRAEKDHIRANVRANRRTRPDEQRQQLAKRLREASHPALDSAQRVAFYVGVGDEPDTLPLINVLHDRGVVVLLPVVLSDFSLDWAEYEGPQSLEPAGYGLLEPTGTRLGPAAVADVDVVLAPALAIDKAGRRVGNGAGCYDRALSLVPADTPVLAVVFDDEILDGALPEDPHDRRVDAPLL